MAEDSFTPEVVETILSSTRQADAKISAPHSILVCWSKADHGKGIHAYQEFAGMMSTLLNKVDKLEAKSVEGFPSEAQWATADLVVFYLTQNELSDAEYALLDAHLKQGKSIIVLHQGLVQRKRVDQWANRIGYAYTWDKSDESKWGPMDGDITLDASHEIFSGFPASFRLKDELYWNLKKGDRGKVTVLGETGTPGDSKAEKKWPVFWTVEHPAEGGAKEARVFCSVVGHIDDLHDAPYFRTILLRGISWCLREPFAPFEPLVKDEISIQKEKQ
jgi:type 1 glutamine amidotransferase